DMLVFNLERAGYKVRVAESGRQAREVLADARPGLVVMDWMLPDISGLELTRQRKRDPDTREIPVVMVTAPAQEDDRVTGLDGGADDYIVKPFSARELLARIRVQLRRVSGVEGEVAVAGELKLNTVSHRVTVGQEEIGLGPTEYRLLDFFMHHPDRVY